MMNENEPPPFDKYHYYEDSVQSPEIDVRFLDRAYREAPGRNGAPRTLREDFCGTFVNCCEWVKLDAGRRAVGVDLDPEPLAYGRAQHLSALAPDQQARVQILEANVLTPSLPKADVIAALNFSSFIFKQRAELLAYFRNCRRTLEPGGVLILDCAGGPDYQMSSQQVIKFDEYTYIFEQESFEPLTHEVVFYLHFQRSGEDVRHKVFTYDFRLWTVPELRDAMLDAGFAGVQSYWEEGTNPEGEIVWALTEEAGEVADDVWLAYLVALG